MNIYTTLLHVVPQISISVCKTIPINGLSFFIASFSLLATENGRNGENIGEQLCMELSLVFLSAFLECDTQGLLL